MHTGLEDWHWQCDSCGYEAATFAPSINEASKHSLVDESGREHGLRPLREKNFRELLRLISAHAPVRQRKLKLLDVGAAHGWFVKIASERFDVTGIEPDHAVCKNAQSQGIPLIEGFFPSALQPNDRFDLIVFNDVFEHIPDVAQILEACKAHLFDQGLLVLNVPTSEGFFYRLSKLLKRLGFGGSFDRMWQKGLPSPHLHYFGKDNLVKLAKHHGFSEVTTGQLPSIRLQGLYDRIAHVGGTSRIQSFITWLGVVIAIPVINCFQSDIAVVIVRKRDN